MTDPGGARVNDLSSRDDPGLKSLERRTRCHDLDGPGGGVILGVVDINTLQGSKMMPSVQVELSH